MKIKIGDIVEIYNEKCNEPNLTVFDVSGINRDKQFFTPTVQVGSDTSNYKIVPPKYFACNLMHVGRDYAIPIAYNETDKQIVVSPAYQVFKIKRTDLVLLEYFFMLQKKNDFDRYAAFCTDSSVRDGLDWTRFCDIDIEVPIIEKQKQVVEVYLALVENQKKYEQGLNDLKLLCDAYIENLRKKYEVEKIGNYLDISNEKNNNNTYSQIIGVATDGIIPPKVDPSEDTSNYNIVKKNYFLYNPSRINIGSIGLYKSNNIMICSPIYNVFHVSSDKLLPDYLMMWFRRDEFKRYTDFYSLASVRNNFSLDLMVEVEIPITDVIVQKSISDIFEVYTKRKQISEKLKLIISQICPVLIRGSLK